MHLFAKFNLRQLTFKMRDQIYPEKYVLDRK